MECSTTFFLAFASPAPFFNLFFYPGPNASGEFVSGNPLGVILTGIGDVVRLSAPLFAII